MTRGMGELQLVRWWLLGSAAAGRLRPHQYEILHDAKFIASGYTRMC